MLSSVQGEEEENFIETQKRDGGTANPAVLGGGLRPRGRKGAAGERDL